MTTQLFVSLLSVPCFSHQKIIQSLEPFVDGFHLDVMDDHFVDNLAFYPDMIKEVVQWTTKTVWLHLMVDDPEKWINRAYVLKKDDRVTIHIEVLDRMSFNEQLIILNSFKKKGLNVGIALNPETPLSICQLLLPHIEHLLIMTVNPGFGGQLFIDSMKEKIKISIQDKKEKGFSYKVAVDGGITKELYDELRTYPVDDFVLGSVLFSEEKDPKNELQKFVK